MTAAVHGRGLVLRVEPELGDDVQPQRRLGVAGQLDGDLVGEVLVDTPRTRSISDQLRQLALGVDARAPGAPCPPRGRAARSASSPTCTRRAPSRWRPRSGWPRRRGRSVRGAAPPPPTPATSAVLLTRPSIAPKTAARSQPPETSAWLWSCASASGQRLGVAHASSASAPSWHGRLQLRRGQRRRVGTPSVRSAGGELAAGAVDVLTAGVADRRRHPGGAQPGDELPLGRQRAGVPLAARRGVERDQVDVGELAGQQLAEEVGPEGLVVDVADQRVLDRVPAAGLLRVGVGGVDDLADLPAGVDRHEGVAQLVVRGVQADREGDVAALLGEPADRRAPGRRSRP